MSVAARLAWRELRGGLRTGLRGFRIFLACLALGVAAIATVGLVRAAIEAGLAREGAALLGGEAAAELTYRFASPEERAWMEAASERLSEVVDFRSLAVADPEGRAERALTQVRGVDGLYPLMGEVTLDPPIPLALALAGHDGRPGIVVERALADRLAVAPSDVLRLGTRDFALTAILVRYPDNPTAGLGLGPRSLVLTEALEGSGLIAEGTLFSTLYRLDLPPGTDLDALAAEAEALWRDRGLRWTDARDGGATAEAVDRLGAFLILVGLSGLAVGGVGVASAVAAYLASKTSVIATLRTLGATRGTVFAVYFLQIGALAALGVALGLALGTALPLLLSPWIEERLPVPAVFAPYPGPLLEAALYGVLAAAVFTLWPLSKAGDIGPAALFRDALVGRAMPRPPYLVATAWLLAVLVGVAAWFSEAWELTLWTAAGIAGALLLLALAALLAGSLARRLSARARGWPAWRLALGAVGARGGEALPVVLSLGLGLSVLAAIGQIDGNLRAAITADLPEIAPSYFVVDIQPDQIEDFRARMDANPAVERVEATPMLRGIITGLEGRPAEEVAPGHWTLQGDRGITYAAEPPPGTVLTEGAWWPADYTGPPFVSFAREEAEELGLGLGDAVTVNVLGRDLTATVASLREVDFQTAGLGFIMILNPSALAGAPHSWIATVYADPEADGPLLREIAAAYPNVTAISVRDVIGEASRIVEGVAAAVRVAAFAALATGFLVLLGAAAAGERARAWEAAVLKTLGASHRTILWSFALRAGLMGLAAGLVALGVGLLGSWAVTTLVMEAPFRIAWGNAAAIILGGTAATLAAGLLFALRPLAARPARILRARD